MHYQYLMANPTKHYRSYGNNSATYRVQPDGRIEVYNRNFDGQWTPVAELPPSAIEYKPTPDPYHRRRNRR